MTWVFEHSPYTLGTRLVHLAIADAVNDKNDWLFWGSHAGIASMARVSRGTVVTAFNRMVDDGYLEVVEARSGRPSVYRFIRPRVADIEQVAPEPPVGDSRTPCAVDAHPPARSTKSHSSLTQIEPKEPNGAESGATATETPSRRVVKAMWEKRNPRPTAKFLNLVAMAQRFLDAGWDEERLTAAMTTTRAFTDAALEFELRRGGPQQRERTGPEKVMEELRVEWEEAHRG